MKILLFLMLLLSIGLSASIQQLNPKKLKDSIENNKFTLVYVYSSSCGFCKTFTPKFQQTSKVYPNQEVVFGKLDGPAHKQLTQKYRAYSYPTIMLFWQGIDKPIVYYKERETENLLQFLKQATKVIDAHITLQEYSKLSEEMKNQGIFYRGPKDHFNMRVTTVLSYIENYRPFLRLQNSDNEAASLEIKGQKYSNFDVEILHDTILRKFAKLHIISEESWLNIHEKRQPAVLFVDKKGNKQIEQLLTTIASEYPKIIFLKIDPAQQEYKPALDAFGIINQESIFGIMKEADALFKANQPYTKENLKQFIMQFMNLTWPVYRKSQSEGDKYKLTRNKYEQQINVPKDVIVFLYKQDDSMKRKFLELFKYLTTKLKVNENLVFYRCNLSKNEIEEKIGFIPKVTPSIFFLRNKMKDYPIHFHQRTLSLETIVQFILQNTTFDWDDSWIDLDEL